MAYTLRFALALCGLTIGLAGCNVYQPQAKTAETEAAGAQPLAERTAVTVDTRSAPAAPEASEPAVAAPIRLADPFRRADASFSRFALNSSSVRPQAIGRQVNGDL